MMRWIKHLTALVSETAQELLSDEAEGEKGAEQFLAEAEARLRTLRRALAEAHAQAKRSELAWRASANEKLEARFRTDRVLAEELQSTVLTLQARLTEIQVRATSLNDAERRVQWLAEARQLQHEVQQRSDELTTATDRLAAREDWRRERYDTHP